jgi:hypothetical protein
MDLTIPSCLKSTRDHGIGARRSVGALVLSPTGPNATTVRAAWATLPLCLDEPPRGMETGD